MLQCMLIDFVHRCKTTKCMFCEKL
jgi:hypothetical protein